MKRKHRSSRRTFLKNATLLTAAATTCASQPLMADWRRREPKATKLSLGVKPQPTTVGPIVVETASQTHVTFHGIKEKKSNRGQQEGMVVLSLQGCKTWRFRSPEDDVLPTHSVSLDSLDFCEVYEVKNSDWNPPSESQPQLRQARTLNKRSSSTVLGAKLKRRSRKASMALKHYVITFLGFQAGVSDSGIHFECLAEGISEPFCVKDVDFDVLAVSLKLGATNPSNTKRQSTKLN